ncbi:unnamed protein product [Sphagnum jensenii]|uniref:mitogen-activated protein kinase kinase kinase n=1 Tax=Sphagnum jensenii TaxID=128206 RepID=A0ABP1A6Z2_9BRYO
MSKPRSDRAKGLKLGNVFPSLYGDFNSHTERDRLSSSPTSDHDKGQQSLTKQDWRKRTSFGVRGSDTAKEMQDLCNLLGVDFSDGLGIPTADWEARKSLNSRPASPASSQPISPTCAVGLFAYSSSDGDDFRSDLQTTSQDSSPPVASPLLSPMMSPGRLLNAGKELKKHLRPPRDIPPKPVHSPQKTGDLFSPSTGSSFQQLKEVSHVTLNSQDTTGSRSVSVETSSSTAWNEEVELDHQHSEPTMKCQASSPPNFCKLKPHGDNFECKLDVKGEREAEIFTVNGNEERFVKDFLTREVRSPPLLVTPSHMGVGHVSTKQSPRYPSPGPILWHGKQSQNPPPMEHIDTKPANADSHAVDNAPQHLTDPWQVASPVDNTAQAMSAKGSKMVESDLANLNLCNAAHKDIPLQVPPKTPPWCSKWRKGDRLGSGSFGTVYEGVGNNGRFFAVKEVSLLDEGRQAKQSILQLQQEIIVLSELKHENIVQYLGTETTEDKLYIFLELVSKGSLASVYKKYPMFEEQVRVYTRQILHGLKYLHDRKIIHRDIKCANLLVNVNGVVKLADFGMAKEVDNMDKLNSCKGSAYWMAPEVINITESYGIAADIWSLGCTVLEMVMGKPPLSDLEWHEVLWKVGNGEGPPIPENLSCDLKDFVKQCLEVDVKRRATVDTLLTHPLVCSEPIFSPFKLEATTELSTIAEEKSFHSSKTGPSNATNGEVKNHINGHGSKVVRGRLGHSMRTIRSELSMSSTFCGIPL